jgi:hypothetical protein
MRLPVLAFVLAVVFFGWYRTAQKDGASQSAGNVAATPLYGSVRKNVTFTREQLSSFLLIVGSV